MKISKTISVLSVIVVSFFAISASATCIGNQCGNDGGWSGDSTFGKSFMELNAEGYGGGASEYSGGNVTERNNFAVSESSTEGSTSFNENSCGTCVQNADVISGTAYNFSAGGSQIKTSGEGAQAAYAASGAGSKMSGKGFTFSSHNKPDTSE